MVTSVTVMTTVSGLTVAIPRLSVTVRLNSSTAGVAGAVKVVVDRTPAPLKLTGGPPLCTQRYASGRWPSGSKEPPPSSVNGWLTKPDWSAPASATGGALVTVTRVLAAT